MSEIVLNEMTNMELSDVNGGEFWTGIGILGTVLMGTGLVIAYATVAPVASAALVVALAIGLPIGLAELVGGNV
jgi:hypothetical protein